ncbi:NFX1-type zinc finger-containing protein 1-like [Diadema antillarum]|uniref:NFX1-type zinc finger-containing protein 1-like n=1 Tax=Diadema antillarum TaxID=105358 RepID=UPI003A89EDAA
MLDEYDLNSPADFAESATHSDTESVSSVASSTTIRDGKRRGRHKKQNQRSDGGRRKSEFGPNLSVRELQILLRDKSVLAVEMRSRKSLLEQLLKDDDIGNEMMLCLLKVLALISQTHDENAREVFNFFAKQQFIKVHLLLHALRCRLQAETGMCEENIHHLVEISQAFVEYSSVYDASSLLDICVVLTVVHDSLTCYMMKTGNRNDKIVSRSLGIVQQVLSGHLPEVEKLQATSRSTVPIFPTAGEVVDTDAQSPLLSYTRREGPSSVDDFLDVHFHILREDIVGPLRAVISKYHRIKRLRGIHAAQRECHVYTGVKIVEENAWEKSDSLTFQIRFDTSHLGNISWDTTKILSCGSMLCLTTSHFHHMIFAMVSSRDVKLLKLGYVKIQVLRTEDVTELCSGKTFFMIDSWNNIEESSATLQALQQLSADSLPLASHIVFQSPSGNCQGCLKSDTNMTFDVGPLLKEETKTRRTQPTFRIHLQQPDEWPTDTRLNVDGDQLVAIKAALTNEMTVITGQPGTGKTYVGLKLVQLFLCNIHSRSETGSLGKSGVGGPILFICASKATLDEFLVQVLMFQRSGIVRVGPLSCRKILQDHNLERYREKQTPPTTERTVQEKLKNCKERCANAHRNMLLLRKSVLPENVLKPIISAGHYQSLKEGNEGNGAIIILDWLVSDIITKDDLDMLKRELPPTVTCFSCKEETLQDCSWIDQEMPCALDPVAAQLAPKARDKIGNQLQSRDKMTNTEVESVTNVWNLNSHSRWRLYRHWVLELEKLLRERITALSTELTQTSGLGVQEETDFMVFRSAKLIGMTAANAIKHREAIHRVSPQVVICDEAGDILQSTSAAFLPPSCNRLVLLGKESDTLHHFQLAKRVARDHNVEFSLMGQCLGTNHAVYKLQTQHRMSPTCSKISRLILGEEYQPDPSVTELPPVSGVANSVFFIEHNDKTSPELFEASFLTAFYDFLVNGGLARKHIAVVVHRHSQKSLFKGNISERLLSIADLREERDVILFMCSGSGRESRPGYLLEEQALQSVLTRARRGLYAIGNFTLLAKQNQFWGKIIEAAQRLEWVGPHLQLTCSNQHKPTGVSTAEELVQYTKNGCNQPCQARLPCGHSCKESCHNHNQEESQIICRQPCGNEICKNGHKCSKLCSEPCNTKCGVRVEKVLQCGHSQMLPCYLPVHHATCREQCSRKLPCGHKCTNLCRSPCSKECTELTKKSDYPCGHTVEVRCCDGPETCPHPCNTLLACGHPCSGTCGKCLRGRIHVACEQPCGRTLVCGHACESSCSAQCPPCPKPCENRCQHSACRNLCGEACVPCKENCLWQCPHVSCLKLCGQPCDRKPCNEPCKKILPCGHPCIGLCGEKCPSKCRVCDKEEVTEIFFGSEDDDDARFVELEDCGHIIEVDALDQYMAMSQDSDDTINIQLKGCPRCKTPIRRNVRYGNAIKKALSDVEAVKTMIRGSDLEIERKMEGLRSKIARMRQHLAYHDGFIVKGDFTKLLQCLEKFKHLEKAVSCLNRFAFLQALADIFAKLAARNSYSSYHSSNLSSRRTTITHQLEKLKKAILEGPLDRFTEQQVKDFQQEVSRVDLSQQVFTVLSRNLPSLQQTMNSSALKSFDKLICQEEPFTKGDEHHARQLLHQVKQLTGHVVLGITDRERVQIVTAIGLNQGHWYKCPKGHVYCIGECGGAMENANCPECGASIGGQSHTLTSGNRVATEMDGARRAAWPTGYDDDIGAVEEMHFNQEEIQEQFEIQRQIEVDRREAEERRNRDLRRAREERRVAEERRIRELQRAREERRLAEERRDRELQRAREERRLAGERRIRRLQRAYAEEEMMLEEERRNRELQRARAIAEERLEEQQRESQRENQCTIS